MRLVVCADAVYRVMSRRAVRADDPRVFAAVSQFQAKAESGGAVVVSLLRGFGHEMLTSYAFGQRMLACSAHHLRR